MTSDFITLKRLLEAEYKSYKLRRTTAAAASV